MRVCNYLFFNGNCEEAFKFYEKVLDGKITAMMSHTGTPASEHVPTEWQEKIIHAALNIGNDTLMASDAPPGHQDPMKGFSVSLHFDSADEGRRIFDALAVGGTVTMPFAPTFWSQGFGMLVDRFGTPWMVNGPAPEGAA